MLVTGSKLIYVPAHGSMTSIEKMNDSFMSTPEPGNVSCGIVAVTVTECVPKSPVFVVSILKLEVAVFNATKLDASGDEDQVMVSGRPQEGFC